MPKEAKNKENKKVKQSKERKHFLKDTKAELKKVIWPNGKQLFNNTAAVIAVVLIIGVIVFVLDVCFEKVNEFGVERIKSIVQSVDEENVESTNEIEGQANSEGESDIEVVTEGESEESSETSENVENAE